MYEIWKVNPVPKRIDPLDLLTADYTLGDWQKNPMVNTKRAIDGAAHVVPTKAQQLFQGQKHKKKHKKISILDQWIEIRIDDDGRTITQLSPSNEGLIERGQSMSPPPVYVYRRLNFVDRVPPEYHWVTNDPKRRENGGMCLQRMSIDTWLEVIEREKIRGDGHIGVTGIGNMPRPKERGGCDCEVCTHNAPFFPGV